MGAQTQQFIQHRWSGWPGAVCLKCGVEDLTEAALANGWDGNSPLPPQYLNGPCQVVKFEIPYLPPSSNNCYITIWRKKMRVLSKEGQAFKKRVLTEIVPNYLNEISLLDRTAVYEVFYRYFFPRDEVMTKTWGAEKNGAKSQYKKMDLENRLKLLSDVLSSAIGIDDSQFFVGHQEKYCCDNLGGIPQVHIYIRKRTYQEFGF